jgi:hypothetical protein
MNANSGVITDCNLPNLRRRTALRFVVLAGVTSLFGGLGELGCYGTPRPYTLTEPSSNSLDREISHVTR